MHGNAEKYTQGLYDGYREAMLWAEEDRITEELKANGVAEPDLNIHTSFSPSAIAKIQKDLTDFTAKYSETIELFKEEEQTDDSQVGHSFWLTRQGHGAGFFDFSGEAANVLYKACDWQGEFSELNYYVGDDNLIYFMGFEDTVGDPAPAEVEASKKVKAASSRVAVEVIIKKAITTDVVASYLLAEFGEILGIYPDGSVSIGQDIGREIDPDERPLASVACPGIGNIDGSDYENQALNNDPELYVVDTEHAIKILAGEDDQEYGLKDDLDLLVQNLIESLKKG